MNLYIFLFLILLSNNLFAQQNSVKGNKQSNFPTSFQDISKDVVILDTIYNSNDIEIILLNPNYLKSNTLYKNPNTHYDNGLITKEEGFFIIRNEVMLTTWTNKTVGFRYVREYTSSGKLKSYSLKKNIFEGILANEHKGPFFEIELNDIGKLSYKRYSFDGLTTYSNYGIQQPTILTNDFINKKNIKDSLYYNYLLNLKFKNFCRIKEGIFLTDDTLNINAFYIQKTKVSNKQYRNFYNTLMRDSCENLGEEFVSTHFSLDTSATDSIVVDNIKLSLKDYYTKSQYEDYPVINISWYVAMYYCSWLQQELNKIIIEISNYNIRKSTAKYKIGKYFNNPYKEIKRNGYNYQYGELSYPPFPSIIVTLPGQIEWEYAATHGKGWDAYKGLLLTDKEQTLIKDKKIKDKTNDLWPKDMLGNIGEWCLDSQLKNDTSRVGITWYRPPSSNPYKVQHASSTAVICGGNYNTSLDSLNNNFSTKQFKETSNSENSKSFRVTGFRPVIYILDVKKFDELCIDGQWLKFIE